MILMHAPLEIKINPWNDISMAKSNILLVGAMVTDILKDQCPQDILTRRKFCIHKDGIYIDIKPSLFGLFTVYIKEVHEPGLHYMWITAGYEREDGLKLVRHYMLPIEDFTKGVKYFFCDFDYTVLLFIFHFLGVYKEWKAVFQKPALEILNVIKTLRELSIQMESSIPNVSISYAQYRGSGNQGVYHGYDRKSAYVIEKREIGHFTRKLPSGCEASDDAKRKAKQYCMELPQGHTFVSDFERSQRVSLTKGAKKTKPPGTS